MRRRRAWVVLSVLTVVAGLAAIVWRVWPAAGPGFVEYQTLLRTDIPTALAAAPDGTVWFTIEMADAIGVIRNGAIDRLPKKTQNLEPLGLAVDAAGRAWYTDAPLRAIARISADGAIQTFPLGTPVVRLGRLAVGPDGAVWFADGTTAAVTRLKDGAFTRYEPRSGAGTPFGVAVDAQGVVWATLPDASKLMRVGAGGDVAEFDVPSRAGGLGDVAVDPHGAVWFLEPEANKIGRFLQGRFTEFAIPTPAAGLTSLATARDGSVWFTQLRAGRLGRLRDGLVTEFPLPRARARPFGVVVDGSGNVWYTDLSGWVGMLPARRAMAR